MARLEECTSDLEKSTCEKMEEYTGLDSKAVHVRHDGRFFVWKGCFVVTRMQHFRSDTWCRAMGHSCNYVMCILLFPIRQFDAQIIFFPAIPSCTICNVRFFQDLVAVIAHAARRECDIKVNSLPPFDALSLVTSDHPPVISSPILLQWFLQW